jgi:ABC-type sugar transport system ATPase subunit
MSFSPSSSSADQADVATAEDGPPPVLRVRGIAKAFGGSRALDDVDLDVPAGRVLGLVGQNGAGKSTLISIMAGVLEPDAGSIEVDGAPIVLSSPATALGHGIVAVYQELSLVPELTVAENLFLGLEPSAGPWLRRADMRRRAREILVRLGADAVAVDARVRTLPVVQQQLVEIGKALARDARVLILDEPSAVLGRGELERLCALVDRLRDEGIAVIYITHRLDEVVRLADDVAVMRDGRCVLHRSMAGLSRHDLIEAMIGRRLSLFEPTPANRDGSQVLAVRELRFPGTPSPGLSFDVRAGEIVGIAGLTGSGRSRLLRALAGLETVAGGQVTVDGTDVRLGGARRSMAGGFVLVPEDRKRFGLVLERSTRDNLTLSVLSRYSSRGVQRRGRLARVAAGLVAQLGIKVADPGASVQFLSGGNQQKVVLGRCLATEPRVLLLDEPLRGVDVGAKAEILDIVRSVAARGAAIIAVSSEFEDLVALTDRIMIMRDGDIVGELNGGEVDEAAALAAATATGGSV